MKVSQIPKNLFTIKRKNGKALQSYIERFNSEYINILWCLNNVVVSAFKLGLYHGSKVKEDLTVKSPHNLEEILPRTKGFVKLEEENAHKWGNISRGRDSHREVSGRMERDQCIVRDPKYQVQRLKAQNRVGLGRVEPHMMKPLRNYNPRDEVVSKVL